MNPPFSITIEITEASQCHAAVSQLLRVFPKLRLTITEHETIPASTCSPQTGPDHYLDADTGNPSPYCPCDACGSAYRVPARLARLCDNTSGYLSAVGADEAGKAAVPSYPWTPAKHTEAAALVRAEDDFKRHAADYPASARKVIDRGDDNANAGSDSKS